jgi:phosphatidylethanolamine/phosphatidyl-N-methylethanolamine N-methyltransferase
MSIQSTLGIAKRTLRLDDEVRFIRSWMEQPLSIGAVMPSGKPLARAMAKCVASQTEGSVIELGPGTGAVTAALVEQGIEPSRLVLVEFNPTFCRLLRTRYPQATVVQGDAYKIKRLLVSLLRQPAAAVVSGLPLFTKPLKLRVRLLADAFTLLAPNAPFVQFTYAIVPPIPRSYSGANARASERIWLNIPPARVWVYRKA